MCVASGVFVLASVTQPALAQTRRAGAATQPNATTPEGTSSGSDLSNYCNERADQWISLGAEKRQAINIDLQVTVVELLYIGSNANNESTV